jgi:hypothetical protein
MRKWTAAGALCRNCYGNSARQASGAGEPSTVAGKSIHVTYKHNHRCKRGVVMHFSVYNASVPGSRHKNDPLNNQDFCGFKITDNAVLMAVCDGAGSVSHARQGAEFAAARCLDFLSVQAEHFPDMDETQFNTATQSFLVELLEQLKAEAKRLGLDDYKQLSTTLVAVMLHEDGHAALQVGDGFIVTGDANGYKLVFHPVNGEYSNETVFVTSEMALSTFQTCYNTEAINFICLSTDGLMRQAVTLATMQPHAPFFNYLRTLVHAGGASFLERFLNLPEVDEKTDDDRTLLIAAMDTALETAVQAPQEKEASADARVEEAPVPVAETSVPGEESSTPVEETPLSAMATQPDETR